MRYKAVLFDMDGVILDSEPLHIAAFQATLGRHGHELSKEDYKVHFAGKTDEAGFESYFKFINEELNLSAIMSEKANKYLELASGQIIPYPGIVTLIKKLADVVPLALVTGSLRAEANVALGTFGIIQCFKVIVAAEDILQSKPSPEGYNKAAAQLGLSPNQCVIIEDSPNGIKAALAAGADCIAVTNTHSAEELHEANNVVERLEFNMF
jgi:HAD superfamily hydrolase (TIGR01509 family)